MAGRGTDIMLGGNPDFIADEELRARGLSPTETPEEYEAAWDDALAKAKEQVAAEHDEVVEAGGLYVLGTERHESRRIDNQLRGRSGRQGDPGESRFYLSLGDDLMRRFNGPMLESMMNTLRVPEDQPIESKMVTRAIRSAQTQVEQQNFEVRKDVLKYDEVLNRQRTVIYDERRKILDGADLQAQVQSMIDDVVGAYVDGATETGYAEDWDLDLLWNSLKALYPVGLDLQDLLDRTADGEQAALDAAVLKTELLEDVHRAYESREESLGAEVMRELERRVLLSVLDRKWREHLYEMDYLRAGIHLRAMAQRDPVVEYQREGFDMFTASRRSRSGSCSTWRSRPRSSRRPRPSPPSRPPRPRRWPVPRRAPPACWPVRPPSRPRRRGRGTVTAAPTATTTAREPRPPTPRLRPPRRPAGRARRARAPPPPSRPSSPRPRGPGPSSGSRAWSRPGAAAS
jgi:preprotein translocase subunit SecA